MPRRPRGRPARRKTSRPKSGPRPSRVVVARGPSIRGVTGSARHTGVLTYPVFADSSGTSVPVLIPLQLQQFLSIWPHAQLYSKVRLNSWSVRYDPNVSTTRDGTVSLLFDPDSARVMSPDEDTWMQSKNAHLIRACIYNKHSLNFKLIPEYHEGGIVNLKRSAATDTYKVLTKNPSGWTLSNAGTPIPVDCSYGTTTTSEGSLNSLIPALAYITHDVREMGLEPHTMSIVGFLTFTVDITLMQMELGTTENVEYVVLPADAQAVSGLAQSSDAAASDEVASPSGDVNIDG